MLRIIPAILKNCVIEKLEKSQTTIQQCCSQKFLVQAVKLLSKQQSNVMSYILKRVLIRSIKEKKYR